MDHPLRPPLELGMWSPEFSLSLPPFFWRTTPDNRTNGDKFQLDATHRTKLQPSGAVSEQLMLSRIRQRAFRICSDGLLMQILNRRFGVI